MVLVIGLFDFWLALLIVLVISALAFAWLRNHPQAKASTSDRSISEATTIFEANALVKMTKTSSAATIGQSPVQSSNEYRNKLMEAAAGKVKSGVGDIRRGKGIYTDIQSGTGDITLKGSIVLGKVTSNVGDLEGWCLGGPDASFNASVGDNDLRVKAMSYKQLHEEAVKQGLI